MSLLAATPIIFLVTFDAKGPGFQEMEACSLLVNLRKGMQRSSEQPLVREMRYVATLGMAAKETTLIKVEIWMGDQSLRSSLRDFTLHPPPPPKSLCNITFQVG